MARQRLGTRKHALCEKATGRKYDMCLVRGNTAHFWAICQWAKGENPEQTNNHLDADWVNYKTGEWEPYTRNGKFVEAP